MTMQSITSRYHVLPGDIFACMHPGKSGNPYYYQVLKVMPKTVRVQRCAVRVEKVANGGWIHKGLPDQLVDSSLYCETIFNASVMDSFTESNTPMIRIRQFDLYGNRVSRDNMVTPYKG